MFTDERKQSVGIILIYLAGIFLAMLIGYIIFGLIGAAIYNLELGRIIEIVSTKQEEVWLLEKNEQDVYYFMNSYLNFFQYFIIAIGLAYYARPSLKYDFHALKRDSKRMYIMACVAVVAVALLYGISALFEYFVKLLSDNNQSISANQNMIVDMIKNGHGVIVFITVFFLAPLVEEFVYRKAIFGILSRFPRILPIIVSSLIFALPHMLSQTGSAAIWIVLFTSYFLSGLVLALIYHFSNKNIYISILCHALNNLLAFLLIVL